MNSSKSGILRHASTIPNRPCSSIGGSVINMQRTSDGVRYSRHAKTSVSELDARKAAERQLRCDQNAARKHGNL